MSEVTKYPYRIEVSVGSRHQATALGLTQNLAFESLEIAHEAYSKLKTAMADAQGMKNSKDLTVEICDAAGMVTIPCDEIRLVRLCNCETWSDYAMESARRQKQLEDAVSLTPHEGATP